MWCGAGSWELDCWFQGTPGDSRELQGTSRDFRATRGTMLFSHWWTRCAAGIGEAKIGSIQWVPGMDPPPRCIPASTKTCSSVFLSLDIPPNFSLPQAKCPEQHAASRCDARWTDTRHTCFVPSAITRVDLQRRTPPLRPDDGHTTPQNTKRAADRPREVGRTGSSIPCRVSGATWSLVRSLIGGNCFSVVHRAHETLSGHCSFLFVSTSRHQPDSKCVPLRPGETQCG